MMRSTPRTLGAGYCLDCIEEEHAACSLAAGCPCCDDTIETMERENW